MKNFKPQYFLFLSVLFASYNVTSFGAVKVCKCFVGEAVKDTEAAKKVQAEFKVKAEDNQKKFEEDKVSFQKKVEGFQKKQAVLNANKQMEERQKLAMEEMSLQRKWDGVRDSLQQESDKKHKPIHDKVVEVAQEISNDMHCDFLFKEYPGSRSQVYAREAIDITKQTTSLYDKRNPVNVASNKK